MNGSPLVALEFHGNRIWGRLECGHEFHASIMRTDLFRSLKSRRPVHCWDCDREKAAQGKRVDDE